jgi:hypothetical protein
MGALSPPTMTINQRAHIRHALQTAYEQEGLWGERPAPHALPEGVERGDETHLVFLTLVYTMSGGRDPIPLWTAARQALPQFPHLFDPQHLARANPRTLQEPLRQTGLTAKASEATVWHKIGKALVMRGRGSVSAILAEAGHDALAVWDMLQRSKTTFPVLSGEQTAPRWLAGLVAHGGQPLANLDKLALPASAAGQMALANLGWKGELVSAVVWDAVQALGRTGCHHRPAEARCPVAAQCPVAQFCRWGSLAD